MIKNSINYMIDMMRLNFESSEQQLGSILEQDNTWAKIKRSTYLIVSISLLTHTMSVTYSIMSFKEQSMGFIAIIVSSLTCFFLSASHLTIYGISVLGILYISMLQSFYKRSQICMIVGMSGLMIIPFWKVLHSLSVIFHCLPGRIHASMVFGVALIVLTKFFPLAIGNIDAFLFNSQSSPLTNPFQIIMLTFSNFNVFTLILTILIIVGLISIRDKLAKVPLIGILIVIGIIVNSGHRFLSYQDLCGSVGVDCKFYILKLQNAGIPTIADLIALAPTSLVLAAVLIFEQFLYLQEFDRRGKRFGGEGNLGEVRKQGKVLAIANTISGLLGGLPICINMFATYQSFSFNQKYGFKGTKWVGVLQIPVSYCLYGFLKPVYEMIPLFILFTIVATPAIYFLRNMMRTHSKDIFLITFIAVLNVLTHPAIALILAMFISIYEIAELLRPAPAEMLFEDDNTNEKRKSIYANIAQKQQNSENKYISQFVNRVIEIEDDIPDQLKQQPYFVYRLIGILCVIVGAVSFLNYDQHFKQIDLIINKYLVDPRNKCLVLSFRFAQVIDDQAFLQFSYLVEKLRDTKHIRVVFTGLNHKIIGKMQSIRYFSQMLQNDEKSMYSLQIRQA